VTGTPNVITERREGDSEIFGARTSAIQQLALRASTGSVQNARASRVKHI
jgi:hypothetical protein